MVDASGAPGPARATRLAGATSSYLRSAIEQEIDWHPWGPEPFELARRTGRPILLDVGASWCHWCHVMDEGTYADDDVARLLRQHFVAVKVDRDEHPEVDRRYQRQVSALSGEGGWPLTAFLDADGTVFFGGTYFPPTDGHGRPGFRRVLKEIARLWSDEPDTVRHSATTVREALARAGRPGPGAAAELAPFVDRVLGQLRAGFDPVNGGFGGAPKFPHPSAIALLLWDGFRGGASSYEEARETLLRMADGGMYDQLGGGFHRYSVDEGWHVPHFEKMGVDNAELLGVYIDGLRRFAEPRFDEVVRGIVRWSQAVLGDPEGGWGASQDADNAPGDDGSYFTWTRPELRSVLGPETARFVGRVFGVGTDGRMPHDTDRNVLFRLLPLREAAEGLTLDGAPETVFRDACDKLLRAREQRREPTVDRALYAGINGRFLGGYAVAAQTLGEASWLDAGRKAADRWLARAVDASRGVAHQLGPDGPRGFGLLDDQVSFGRGLLELAVADAQPRYLEAARRLFELVDREFRGEDGLLREVAPGLYDGPLVGGATDPSYPLEDSPHLSANSAAALGWLRLGTVLHAPEWVDKARALLGPVAARIGSEGLFAAGAALGAGLAATPPVQVVVEGSGEPAAELARAARRAWHPNATVYVGRPPAPFSLPAEIARGNDSATPRALVCFERSCAPPITDPELLARWVGAGKPEPA